MPQRRIIVDYGAEDLDDFAIYRATPVTTASHVAFAAEDRTAGVWTQYSDRYYAAFVNDLHGNNVEAVWHAPAPIGDAPRRSEVP